MVWALIPESILAEWDTMGILLRKEYATIIPVYTIVSILFALSMYYISSILMTPDLDNLKRDSHYQLMEERDLSSSSGCGIPRIYDIPIETVNKALFD